MTRRKMLGTLACLPSLLNTVPPAAEPKPADRTRLGVGMHSYGASWNAANRTSPAAPFNDALSFLEHCHALGAGGIQVGLASWDAAYASKFRAKAESYQMYFEGDLRLPADPSELDRFDAQVRLAKEAGGTVIRTAMLNGRRYETFGTAEAFQEFSQRSWRALTLAEPIVKKHGCRLAIENHKDWLVPELLVMLHRMSSESVGVCVDTGNSIALVEDPMAVVEAYAPWAVSTHIKDMAVQEFDRGFLLSEVPLGEGFLDLRRMSEILRQANPRIRFNLEMITRDPLRIPCLEEKYWTTLDQVPGRHLAATITMVKARASKQPLPTVAGLDQAGRIKFEDDNVRKCLAYAREHLGL
ncbi:MAG: sugar phosphate isomerase/epimerase [Verrucomicrobia bacterium]|nr:sugar phosphate isomerase/epimerase [Verrucomicrobiota bacterium]